MRAERIPNDVCGEATFVTCRNEIESKGVQFPAAEMSLIKLIGVANRQSSVIARKFLPYCHRNTRLGGVLTNAKIPKTKPLYFYFCYVQ